MRKFLLHFILGKLVCLDAREERLLSVSWKGWLWNDLNDLKLPQGPIRRNAGCSLCMMHIG